MYQLTHSNSNINKYTICFCKLPELIILIKSFDIFFIIFDLANGKILSNSLELFIISPLILFLNNKGINSLKSFDNNVDNGKL